MFLKSSSVEANNVSILGVETERLLDYQAWAGIISIVRWNLCPVIFGSFRGSSELNSMKVTVSLFLQQNAVTGIIPLRNFQEFSAITVT